MKKNMKKNVLTMVVILLLIGAGIGFYYYFFSEKDLINTWHRPMSNGYEYIDFRDDGTYIIQKMFNDGAIGTGGPYTYQKLSDNELIFFDESGTSFSVSYTIVGSILTLDIQGTDYVYFYWGPSETWTENAKPIVG